MIFFNIDDTLLDYRTSQNIEEKAFAHKSSGYVAAPDEFVSLWNEITDRHKARYLSGEISF